MASASALPPGIDFSGPEGKHKIFVGGLSWTTNEDALREHFSNFGSIDEVMIMRDKATGRSRGFAFVTFKDAESLDRALQSPHHQLDGRQIEAKRAIPKAEIASKTKKIFVGGVPHTVNDDQFREFFNRFGEITEALIMRDRTTNKSRGFGFITFAHEDSVDQVFAAGQLQMQGKHVEVKKAEPKRPTANAPANTGAPAAIATNFPGAPSGSTAFPVFYATPFPYAATAFASPYASGQHGQLGQPDDQSFLAAAAAVLPANSPPHAFFSFPSGTSPQGLVPGAAIVSFSNAFAPQTGQAGPGALANSAASLAALTGMQQRNQRVMSVAPMTNGSGLLVDQQRRSPQMTQQPGVNSIQQPKSLQQQPASNAMGLVRTYPAPIGHPPRSPALGGVVGGLVGVGGAPGVRTYPSPNPGLPGFDDAEEDDDFPQPSYAVRHTI